MKTRCRALSASGALLLVALVATPSRAPAARVAATQPQAAATQPQAAARVVSFAKGRWDPKEWTAVRQPNQEEPRAFTQNADSLGVTLDSFKPDDYHKERDNAILVTDTGTDEGQVEVTFQGGKGFNKTSSPGIIISPQITDGVVTKAIGVFVAPYGFVGWMYTPGDQTRPLQYKFVGQLGRTFDPDKPHVLRCRYSKRRRSVALQVDDSDVLVFKFLGQPGIGAFDLDVNSKIGIWGCHGVCDFYEMKILKEPTLPFDWPGQ